MEAGRIGGREEVKGRTLRRASRWSANGRVGGTRKVKPSLRRRGTEASRRLPLVGDEDFRSQGKLILDLGGLLMEAATVRERTQRPIFRQDARHFTGISDPREQALIVTRAVAGVFTRTRQQAVWRSVIETSESEH